MRGGVSSRSAVEWGGRVAPWRLHHLATAARIALAQETGWAFESGGAECGLAVRRHTDRDHDVRSEWQVDHADHGKSEPTQRGEDQSIG